MSRGTVPPTGTKPSICFVAHNALGALTGLNQTHVGGIERQQATMARWLADHGWAVSVVTWDERDGTPDDVDGVRIVALCERDAGLPGLRFFHPKWSSLNSALTLAAADLYYYNCGDLALGQIVLWAGKRDKPVIFSVPSDPDCDPAFPSLRSTREKVLYRFGLTRCQNIIAQSKNQQDMLSRGFSLSSVLLSMPCKGFSSSVCEQAPAGERFQVLWVGRISSEKRLEWLIDVAAKLPDIDFTVVGAANQRSAYAKNILDAAKTRPNVFLAGRVPYEKMADYYHAADVLCCTSKYEGFPNVFLEAWSAGLPVVSTCDPDRIITEHAIGRYVQDVGETAAAIDRLSRDSVEYRGMCDAAVTYFSRNHDPDQTMEQFEKYFVRVLGRDPDEALPL